jgi:hypothetical protein
VLDLQGRPVSGACVRVLDHRWAARREPVTTDREGRFLLTGVGANEMAELHVSGPAIEIKRAGVSTRLAPGARAEEGVKVDVIVGPTKVIEGTVIARDTRQPLAGVVVYGRHKDFSQIVTEEQGPKTITDARGRYRLVGLPKAKQYEVNACPPTHLGYLERTKWVGDTEGLRPIAVDFDVRRGVPVRVRLLNKETRKPVRGHIQYTLARSNPLWAEAIAPYRPTLVLPPRVWFPGCVTDRSGVMEFVAYPGHGAFFAWADPGPGDPPYAKAHLDPADEKKGRHPFDKGDPNNAFLGSSNGYRVLDTDKTDKVLTFDLELVPVPVKKGK